MGGTIPTPFREEAHVPPATYPLFTDPAEYLCFRKRAHGLGFLKEWAERRAILRCLDAAEGVGAFCDAPCGPGRLFPLWRARFPSVLGVELSEPMAEAADRHRHRLGIPGEVRKGDVFDLPRVLPGQVDLVACVRFIYYFDSAGRTEVLRALAGASRRYVLVQYKTLDTRKGRLNAARAARRTDHHHRLKHWCTDAMIRSELAEAGLACLRAARIGFASDFTFVLGAKA